MAELKAARLDVQLRMETVKDKQKSAYDSRHRDAQYQPDDLVLVYTPFRIVKRADRSLWSVRRHPSTTRCRCVQGGISPIQGRSTKRDEWCEGQPFPLCQISLFVDTIRKALARFGKELKY